VAETGGGLVFYHVISRVVERRFAFGTEEKEKVRERFGAKRKTGARRLKGEAAPAGGILWSLRDLLKGVI